MGYIRDKSFGNFGKGMIAPPPAPTAPAAPDFIPLTEVPEDPAAYRQDPRCPEGKIIQPNQTQCTDDPIYIALMERLRDELTDLEAREKNAALRAQVESQQAQIQAEMEQQRVVLDEQRLVQRETEEKQIRMLTIYGIGALGVITIITLVIKLILP